MSMPNSDSRKRLAEAASTPPAQRVQSSQSEGDCTGSGNSAVELPVDVETLDLNPFIDALAKAQYEDLDSHADTMTWDGYKADDYVGARALYVDPMGRYVRRALPLLAGYLPPAEVARLVQEARAEGETDGYEKGLLAPASSWMKGRAEAWDEGLRFGQLHWATNYAGVYENGSPLRQAPNPYRPVPGERSEAGA